jgi:tRNA 2-thiouridine synthesizing protein A
MGGGGRNVGRERYLDNRGLEPPEPLVRTLAALARLAADEVLVIHNDRRPLFLYPQLTERGFRFETRDEPDGSAVVRIWRA